MDGWMITNMASTLSIRHLVHRTALIVFFFFLQDELHVLDVYKRERERQMMFCSVPVRKCRMLKWETACALQIFIAVLLESWFYREGFCFALLENKRTQSEPYTRTHVPYAKRIPNRGAVCLGTHERTRVHGIYKARSSSYYSVNDRFKYLITLTFTLAQEASVQWRPRTSHSHESSRRKKKTQILL